MRFTGSGNFVPNEEYNMKKTVFEARPLNKYELNIFFKTVDNHIPATIAIKYHGEYILPVLFRMMFCLGLRPGEPLRLRTEDVNLETGEVYIRESKKHRDRHLFMSEDLLLLCRKYDDKMPKDREFFFETAGKQIHTPWMTRNFKKLAEKAGLPRAFFVGEPVGEKRVQAVQRLFRAPRLSAWQKQRNRKRRVFFAREEHVFRLQAHGVRRAKQRGRFLSEQRGETFRDEPELPYLRRNGDGAARARAGKEADRGAMLLRIPDFSRNAYHG